LQKYNPIIIVPTFYAKNYEKHCGGLPSGWRRKASKERLPTVVIALAFANIVTFLPLKTSAFRHRHAHFLSFYYAIRNIFCNFAFK